ncbi:S49 family peptidase [Pararhizobium haloflavum]|uniref:S49 family peptidase n=1 Tax=Pararhizobium haloflavum TaxID=2037914 RepID=UPI000C17EE65|nr:S49 family peptidase [Pararhizobium haloflavum]
MNRHLPLLADRVLNRPLLLDPSKAEVILAALEGRILPGSLEAGDEGAQAGDQSPAALHPQASRFVGTNRRDSARGYGLTRKMGSTAIITIDGSLVNRGAWIGASSGLVSYEGIEAQLMDAAGDPEISAIILDINSFGGEATGMFGLAATVRALREQKPIVAFINDVAASAAYGIAASATEVVISPTSVVGSIGVVMLHLDRSDELKAKGVKPTFIHAGAHKVDGNSFGPLTEEVRASLQRDVMTFYDRFLETVEAGRGERTTAAAARRTEAKTFIGQQAIDAGLADRIGTLAELLASPSKPGPSGQTAQETARMSGENENTITAEAHASAVAAARKEGATEASARIKSILSCDAAKGRAEMAMTLAFETDMSAEAAEKVLASAPAGATGKADATLTIEQRAAGAAEMGAGGEEEPIAAAKAGWSGVVDNINARVA